MQTWREPLNDTMEAPAEPGRRWGLIAATVILLLLAGIIGWRVARGLPLFGPAPLNGIVMEAELPAVNFALADTAGAPVALADFRGKIVMLYFGYTFCPDICPTTMAELAKALDELSPRQREQIVVAMVTVDPERDTPDKLRAYLDYFDASFIGLGGSPEQIAAAAAPLGIYYERQAGSADTGYLIDHSAGVIVLDRDGYVRVLYPYDTSYDAMSADLRRLLRE